MKKLMVICAVLILSSTAVFAFQHGKKMDGRGKGMPVVMMVKALDLTADQETQFRAVIKEEREKREVIKEAAKKEMEKIRAQMQEIDDDTFAKLSTVLDETQLQDFKELRSSMMKKKPHRQMK